MSPRFRPLAYLFAIAGAIGCLPLYKPNQLVQAVRDVVFVPNGWVGANHFWFDFTAGIILAALSASA
jgi:AGCS family alanine or glycine:cation symporter